MKGWHKESYRHYLASKGIKTNRYTAKKMSEEMKDELARQKLVQDAFDRQKAREHPVTKAMSRIEEMEENNAESVVQGMSMKQLQELNKSNTLYSFAQDEINKRNRTKAPFKSEVIGFEDDDSRTEAEILREVSKRIEPNYKPNISKDKIILKDVGSRLERRFAKRSPLGSYRRDSKGIWQKHKGEKVDV